MATFRAIVRPYRREDGTHRIYIRVVHKRAHRDIPTPFYVTDDKLTRTLKIKDQLILDKLEDKIREYRERANHIGFLGEQLEIDQYIKLLESQSDSVDFFVFFRDCVKKMEKEGRTETALGYLNAYRKLYKFNRESPLYLNALTKEFVARYFDSLKDLKPNTQISYIGKFQHVYKMALQEFNNPDIGVILLRTNIFDSIKLPAQEYLKDNAIKDVKDMQAIIDAPYTGSWSIDFAKDMFILSFVCLGTNTADFIQMEKSQYKDGILYYRRKKTGRQSKDNVDMQVLVPEVGRVILEKYSGDPKYLIDFQGHSRNNRFARFIHYWYAAVGLEEMPEGYHNIGRHKGKYTFYANRHSMASFARNICGIEYMTVHEMLNHTVPSNYRVTDAYLWKDYTRRWEANDKLMALFDWSFYEKQKKGTVR